MYFNVREHSNIQVLLFSTLNGLEPIGGSAPIFSLGLKSSTVEKPSAMPFSLNCPAQGFPVPAFRLVDPQFLFASLSSQVMRNFFVCELKGRCSHTT